MYILLDNALVCGYTVDIIENILTSEGWAALNRNLTPAEEEALVAENTQLVRRVIRPYFLRGGDYDDLYQEGMIGLLSALRSYDSGRGDNFQSYAALCIKRRVIDAVRRANTAANVNVEPEDPLAYGGRLYSERSLDDPETSVLADEAASEIKSMLDGVASPFEAEVLDGFLEGKTTSQIAAQLGRESKSVANALGRIRAKLAAYLSER